MKNLFNNFIIALAPKAGVTDFAFRKICADFGADMVVTEMISAKAFEHDSRKTIKMLREENHKAIKVVQLFGHEVESVEKIITMCYNISVYLCYYPILRFVCLIKNTSNVQK